MFFLNIVVASIHFSFTLFYYVLKIKVYDLLCCLLFNKPLKPFCAHDAKGDRILKVKISLHF